MLIDITSNDGSIGATIVDTHDLTKLSARITNTIGVPEARSALQDIITWESDTHIRADQEWLRRTAGYASGERSGEFDRMIAYAAQHGWVDESTGRIRVHIEPTVRFTGRVDNVGIAVGDVATSAAFFQSLGFTADVDLGGDPPSATVQLDGSYLYVFQTSSTVERSAPRVPSLSENPCGVDHISFSVDDVDGVYAQLTARGVVFVTEPTTNSEWGLRTAAFTDPDCNLYFLVENVSP